MGLSYSYKFPQLVSIALSPDQVQSAIELFGGIYLNGNPFFIRAIGTLRQPKTHFTH